MLFAAIAILLGFVVLVWSADLFIAGAASIARNIGLSPIVIGLTIVSMGTSAPEVVVSFTAALSGAGALAIGNAIGSNIANMALILGITLLIAPLMAHAQCMRQEVPALLLVTFGVGLLIRDGELTMWKAWLMLGVLAAGMFVLVRSQRRNPRERQGSAQQPLPELAPTRAWLHFLGGLALLIASSKLLVWGAVQAAEMLGVPELVIGLTVVAIGTSLPELAASVTSALRGHTDIALGNIIGSNIFNLLVVMAIPGLFGTLVFEPEALSRDYRLMTALTVFLAVAIFVSRKRNKSRPNHAYLGRFLGALLVSFYGLYYYLLHSSL